MEGAIEVEKDLQFDKALYDELRTRRDFGFEQVGVPCHTVRYAIKTRQCRVGFVGVFKAQTAVETVMM